LSRPAPQSRLEFAERASREHDSLSTHQPAYPAYRHTGLSWLGDLPAHWRTKPLRFACRLNPTKSEVSHLPADTEVSFVPMEAVREFGGMDLSQIMPIEDVLQGYTYFRDGDIVAAKITPCFENGKGSIAEGLTNGLGFGTTELHTLRPGPEFDTGFLFYLTLSHEFRHQGAGHMYGAGGQKRVPEDFIRNFVAPLPPLPEQRHIAAWLDDRTRRIDALVAAKRRLIGLLAEQRTALITHAVTKGFNPAAPMKPSGIDWLGEVPRDWEARRLRHLVSRIEQGWSPEADQREAGDDEWGVMRAGCANGGTFDESDNKALPPGVDPDPSLEIRPGDLLMSRACGSTDLVGSVALVRSCRRKLLLCDKLFRLRYRAKLVTPEFLALALGSRLIRYQLERDLSGAEGLARNIAQGAIKELVVCVPSIPEQQAIVARLDIACVKFDALTAAAETAIARLTEYRQALISAAVTGKVCVCDVVAEATIEKPCAELPIEAPAVAARIGTTGVTRTANKHFQRSVLAAEIIARIGQDRTFGRVKLQKALILAEGHLQLAEIVSQPVRAAAGPFDNAMMRSIQSQLKKSQWYEYIKDGKPLKFVPLAKTGGHKAYFERYWGAKETGFAALMALLARLDTRRSEIVATLYSAWNDFLIDGNGVTDDALVAEVLTKWDPAKTAIPEAKWRAALPWMRGQGLVPTGYGAHTLLANRDRSKE